LSALLGSSWFSIFYGLALLELEYYIDLLLAILYFIFHYLALMLHSRIIVIFMFLLCGIIYFTNYQFGDLRNMVPEFNSEVQHLRG